MFEHAEQRRIGRDPPEVQNASQFPGTARFASIVGQSITCTSQS